MNGIADVTLDTLQPLAFDSYAANRHTGSFVLIDLQSNATMAAGMIRQGNSGSTERPERSQIAVTLANGRSLNLDGHKDDIANVVQTLREAGILLPSDTSRGKQ